MNFLKRFLNHHYYPLNIIEISAKDLVDNFSYLSSLDKNIKIAPVLKSNAYGHGLISIAKILDKLHPPFLCVDSLFEAYELWKSHIKTPILVMGYIDPRSLKTKHLPFSFAVFNFETLDALNTYQPQAKIHIFVDTGMNREGISIRDLPTFVKYIKEHTQLEIEGIMSHFAASGSPENPLIRNQTTIFKKALSIIEENGFHPKWKHIANSVGFLNRKHFRGMLGNVARSGIALYGIDPQGKDKELKPILKLKTHIAQIKILKKGESLGYDFTYTAQKNMKIGVLPIGYYDGVDKRLSNKGFVVLENGLCQIIGSVNMNLTMIDVSGIPHACIGQEVIVYSNRNNDKNSIISAARLIDSIPYEVLIHLASSTKRIVL